MRAVLWRNIGYIGFGIPCIASKMAFSSSSDTFNEISLFFQPHFMYCWNKYVSLVFVVQRCFWKLYIVGTHISVKRLQIFHLLPTQNNEIAGMLSFLSQPNSVHKQWSNSSTTYDMTFTGWDPVYRMADCSSAFECLASSTPAPTVCHFQVWLHSRHSIWKRAIAPCVI